MDPDSAPDPYIIKQKMARTLIPTAVRLLFDILSLKNEVYVPSKSNKQNTFIKLAFLALTKIAGSGSICQRHGSADPDPDLHYNVVDPQHWFMHSLVTKYSRIYFTCTVVMHHIFGSNPGYGSAVEHNPFRNLIEGRSNSFV
jgi:hypothetical protein